MEAKESKKAMSLGKKSIIGLIAGLIIGGILCFVPAGTMRDDFLIGTVFNIVGNGYLNLIKMTIVPFVFATLVMGISSATDVKQVGRIGSKILLIYMCTTVVASMVGIAGGHDPQARRRRESGHLRSEHRVHPGGNLLR